MATCRIFERMDLGIFFHIPLQLDHFCIFPASFVTRLVDCPSDRDGSDDDDCEDGDTYMQPDEDFINQEWAYLLTMYLGKLPEALFNPEAKTWILGDYSWIVGTPDLNYLD
jgi:hypothetical protein